MEINWLTIYGAITGTIGTIISLYLVFHQNWLERPNLLPYITEWITVNESSGDLVIKVRLIVQNKSRIDNTVERVLLQAREDQKFAFAPAPWIILNGISGGKEAHVELSNRMVEEICPENEALILPLNIPNKVSKGDWLGFVIDPKFVDKAKTYHWLVAFFGAK